MLHRTRSLLVVSSLLLLAPALGAQGKSLTLEQVSGRGEAVRFSGRPPAWSWAADGVHLVRGQGEEARWVDLATWEESPPPADAAPPGDPARRARREAAEQALAALEQVDEILARRIAGREVDASEDGAAGLYRHEGALWFHRAGEPARLLTDDAQGAPELEDLAPDGAHVAFVRGNDLLVVATGDGALRALTEDGGAEVFNGKLDWVYQEEIYGRGEFKAFWWSPDSRHVAFLRLDESPVHEFTLIDHIADGHFRVEPEVTHYPKAGDPNPLVTLRVADVTNGEVRVVDLSRYSEDEPLVVRVGWSPDGARVVFQVQDRIQTWLDLNAADPRSGAVTTLLRERSDTWVNVLDEPRWLSDGTFLWLSERSGWKHVYHYRPDGSLIRAVTSGEWPVGRVQHVDEERGLLWFSAGRDRAVDSNEYRVGLGGGGLVRLTRGEGRHAVDFNPARTHFLDRVSSLGNPPSVRLCDADGSVLRELGEAEIPELSEYATSTWKLHEVAARDGFLLDVALLEPVPFDPTASYPVWIPTYSGPDAPSVSNRWSGSAWDQFLAQQGVIVMQVNVRTASGKGQRATGRCYKQLQVQELRDLEDAVDWITAQPWADAKRVGITGYSYGGSMTAFALTHSDRFALGIAGGGVYDWRMYDTVYTERYMSTPQLNPEGYEASSVVAAAENLTGHLFLHCGEMDDNVHMQNTLHLAYALQKAGKQFDLMIYPQSRHGVGDRDQRWHLRQMEWRLMREHLGLGEAARPPSAASDPAPEAGSSAGAGRD